jgi:hypothetical protein
LTLPIVVSSPAPTLLIATRSHSRESNAGKNQNPEHIQVIAVGSWLGPKALILPTFIWPS